MKKKYSPLPCLMKLSVPFKFGVARSSFSGLIGFAFDSVNAAGVLKMRSAAFCKRQAVPPNTGAARVADLSVVTQICVACREKEDTSVPEAAQHFCLHA